MAYDVKTLLAAFQASFIYVIAQGEGTSSLTCNNQDSGVVHSMLKNCGVGLSQDRTSRFKTRLKLTDLG